MSRNRLLFIQIQPPSQAYTTCEKKFLVLFAKPQMEIVRDQHLTKSPVELKDNSNELKSCILAYLEFWDFMNGINILLV